MGNRGDTIKGDMSNKGDTMKKLGGKLPGFFFWEIGATRAIGATYPGVAPISTKTHTQRDVASNSVAPISNISCSESISNNYAKYFLK